MAVRCFSYAGPAMSHTDDASTAPTDEHLTCSARGCRAPAAWGLRWNNPRLHPPERRKTWLACDDHRETLGAFLSTRSFLKETVPVAELPAEGA